MTTVTASRRRRPVRPRKRRPPPPRVNREYLIAWDEAIILRDIAALGGRVTVAQLRAAFPMRYSSYLPTRLRLMTRDGTLSTKGTRTLDGFNRRYRTFYSIPESRSQAHAA